VKPVGLPLVGYCRNASTDAGACWVGGRSESPALAFRMGMDARTVVEAFVELEGNGSEPTLACGQVIIRKAL